MNADQSRCAIRQATWTGAKATSFEKLETEGLRGGARSSTSTHYTGSSCGARYCYDHYEERTTQW